MLLEPGPGTLPCWRDHLALDEPKAGADLAHLNPGSGCGSGGICRHLFFTLSNEKLEDYSSTGSDLYRLLQTEPRQISGDFNIGHLGTNYELMLRLLLIN